MSAPAAHPAEHLEAELTWTGDGFEPGIRVTVGDDGRIRAVGPAPGSSADTPPLNDTASLNDTAPVHRLPGRALVPGFVNAHSHAFQRGLRGRGERFDADHEDFWSWRQAMYGLVESLTPERLHALSLAAFREMRAAGVTTVGEFHYLHHAADPGPSLDGVDWALDDALIEAATEAGLRLVLLQTYYARSGFGDEPLEPAQRRFASPSVDAFVERLDELGPRLAAGGHGLGVVAHSVRAAAPEAIRDLAAEAARRELPFHMHLEEQPREIDECRAATGRTPSRLLADLGVLSPRFTAVHATHTDSEGAHLLGAAGARVCLCPTTEANLGDGIADVPGLTGAGVELCLGSDSNAVISPIEEARWMELVQRLERRRRGVLRDADGRVGPVLLHAATAAGAAALAAGPGGPDAGTITPGARADLVTLDLNHPKLAGWTQETLLESLFLGADASVLAENAVAGRWEKRPATE